MTPQILIERLPPIIECYVVLTMLAVSAGAQVNPAVVSLAGLLSVVEGTVRICCYCLFSMYFGRKSEILKQRAIIKFRTLIKSKTRKVKLEKVNAEKNPFEKTLSLPDDIQ